MLNRIFLATFMIIVMNSGQAWASSSDEEGPAYPIRNARSTPTTFDMEGFADDSDEGSDEGSDAEDKALTSSNPKVRFIDKTEVIPVMPAELSDNLTAAEIASLNDKLWEKHFHAEMAAVAGDQKAIQIVLHKWMDASAPRVTCVKIEDNK